MRAIENAQVWVVLKRSLSYDGDRSTTLNEPVEELCQTFSSHSDTKFSNACVLANSCLFLSNKDYKEIKGKSFIN